MLACRVWWGIFSSGSRLQKSDSYLVSLKLTPRYNISWRSQVCLWKGRGKALQEASVCYIQNTAAMHWLFHPHLCRGRAGIPGLPGQSKMVKQQNFSGLWCWGCPEHNSSLNMHSDINWTFYKYKLSILLIKFNVHFFQCTWWISSMAFQCCGLIWPTLPDLIPSAEARFTFKDPQQKE